MENEIDDKIYELQEEALKCARLAYGIHFISGMEKSDDALKLNKLIVELENNVKNMGKLIKSKI